MNGKKTDRQMEDKQTYKWKTDTQTDGRQTDRLIGRQTCRPTHRYEWMEDRQTDE